MRSGLGNRGRRRAATPARVESLDSRTLMSAAPSFSLVHDPMSLDAPGRGRAHILVPGQSGNLEAGTTADGGSTSDGSQTAAGTPSAFDVKIVAGSGLAANPAALAAFERAAAQWEARITDAVTVTINADLSDLGNTSTIGQTSSVQIEDAFGVVRNAMVADAADEAGDDDIVNSLPATGNFLLPSRFSYSGNLAGSKAAIKSLGFAGLDDQFGAKDADITFNSRFAFDYDNADGVVAGRMDFETVAAHEIGHALGFASMVDTVDYYARYNLGITVPASTLDLFRFENDTAADPADAEQFRTFARSLRPNVDAVTDGVFAWEEAAAEERMSTGYYTGDGRQASHWKDNDLTGRRIGIHDPTLGTGQAWAISDADWRAMDLIGWDIGNTNGTTNQAPDAVADAAATGEDDVLTVAAPGVLANDVDPDGDALRASAVGATSARGAAVTVNADGSYTYDPRGSAALQALAAGATVNDTFTYALADGRGGSDTATVTVAVTGADEAPGTVPPGDGLLVRYFNSGTFTNPVGAEAVDPDGTVNEDWGVLSPAAGVSSDNFTVRWRGRVVAPATGAYTFYAKVDDNVRLWVNDQLVIRRWGTANTSEWKTATPVTLEAGKAYNIQMDFREMSGGASAALRWAAPGAGVAKQLIPKSALHSSPAPAVLSDPYLTDKNRKNDNTTVGVDNGNGSLTLTTTPASRPGAADAAGSPAVTVTDGTGGEDEVDALLA